MRRTPGQAPIEPEQALASLLQRAGVAVEHIQLYERIGSPHADLVSTLLHS
ncbi:MAG TPA: hypothetical protein VN767_22950 [Streptosporangiaceae bacterium]|nr:hypothetical protein [Streptosporangiaceae bacterium]